MKLPWRRLWRDALHSPKIVSLTDRQHRAWTNCLLIADEDGRLPSLRDISVHLRMAAQDAETLLIDLVEAGLIDASTDAAGRRTYVMHDWSAWQIKPDHSTERVQRHRQSKRAAAENLPRADETVMKRGETVLKRSETPPDSDSEEDSDLPPLPPAETLGSKCEDDFGVGVGEEFPPDGASARRKASCRGVSARSDEPSPEAVPARRPREPTIDARRRVCRKLDIADAGPLVEVYLTLDMARSARDPDAVFISQAERLFAMADEPVRRACRPPAHADPPATMTVARPSSHLVNLLTVKRGNRHAS